MQKTQINPGNNFLSLICVDQRKSAARLYFVI
jgi:hypothetical protein